MDRTLSTSTLVVVVTYNPEISLLKKNVSALSKQFENILIVDNGSSNIAEIKGLASQMNIDVDALGENKGIAYAQNVGIKSANNKNLKWLMTMDQDSVIPDNLTTEYQKIAVSYQKIGLIAWSQRPEDQTINEEKIIEDEWLILASGCLYSVGALNKVGGFDNKFFIDHVDTDANLKIKSLGYKTITTNQVILNHQLGEKTNKKTLRGKFYLAHSPLRVYYNIRNSVVVFKRFILKKGCFIPAKAVIVCGLREEVYLLIYQPNKLKNFLFMSRAWFDGIFNRLGKFKK